MSDTRTTNHSLDIGTLRQSIQDEYTTVAQEPTAGFHFHTGRPLAHLLGYSDACLSGIPERSVASFAGTGNPFSAGPINPGEHVVDVACGAGMDSLIAARMVGPDGCVIGVDMTPAMLDIARHSATEARLTHAAFIAGYAEALPIADAWADVVISNGALNLMPDKLLALREMARVLKPGGRLQIGDIVVAVPVPEEATADIALWTG